jgi:hypothetical protein
MTPIKKSQHQNIKRLDRQKKSGEVRLARTHLLSRKLGKYMQEGYAEEFENESAISPSLLSFHFFLQKG